MRSENLIKTEYINVRIKTIQYSLSQEFLSSRLLMYNKSMQRVFSFFLQSFFGLFYLILFLTLRLYSALFLTWSVFYVFVLIRSK